MSCAERWAAQDGKPEPRTTAQLTRAELAGRIWAVRRALDELKSQADRDGAGIIPGYGALKVTLMRYENELQDRDKAAAKGEPYPLEVAFAVAAQSVRKGA